jgi:MYXO-CTERM domain-containing protein
MKSRFALVAVSSILLAAGLAHAQNTGARLTDGTAIFDYAAGGTGALPTSSTGAGNVPMNFQLSGAPATSANRQIFSGNWYYRVTGDTRERHLFNATSCTVTGTNQVSWDFGNLIGPGLTAPSPVAGTSATMSYTVLSTGVDSALLLSSLRITNTSSSPLSIDLFNAYDIDLGANSPNFGGDIYAPLDTSGGNRTWSITDTTAAGGPWSALFRGFGAQGAGAGGFSAINGQMTDTNVDNFIPDLNAGGLVAADSAAVMQWRLVIAPDSSVTVSSALGIGRNGAQPSVPTPGALALISLGGLAASRRRRA